MARTVNSAKFITNSYQRNFICFVHLFKLNVFESALINIVYVSIHVYTITITLNITTVTA